MKQGLVQKEIWKYSNGHLDKHCSDELAQEEPLEIFIDDLPYSVTMRLPGDDLSLVQGMLFSAGIVDCLEQIESIASCSDSTNRIHVGLKTVDSGSTRGQARKTEIRSRPQVSLSSCGVCGNLNLEELFLDIPSLSSFDSMDWQSLFRAKDDLESRMDLFFQTGCVHAVALYTQEIELLAFGEDIGRHNAFDKCLGKVLSEQRQKDACLAVCSSRLSLEMVQKAARLGIQVLAGMSAATSLAVDLAQGWNMTLVGFLRGKRCNIYTWPERIKGLENLPGKT